MNKIRTMCVGDYEYSTGHCLGQGAFGKVYLCTKKNSKNNEQYALKEIKLQSLNSKEEIELIRSEYRIGNKIEHENIVHVKDLIDQQQKGYFYLVLELCDSNLQDLMRAKNKSGSPFSENQAFFIANQICEAFKVLNQAGVIHRDLKPQNIMIKDGTLKIGDFGVSKVTEQNISNRTQAGTPLYMPLQVLKGDKYTDKYDVWAFGCIFYQLLHGQLPWRQVGKQQVIKMFQKNKNVSQIAEIPQMKIRKDLSFQANELLNQCLQIDHIKRYNWKKLLSEYSKKNNFYKKKSSQFREKFKKLLENYINSENQQNSKEQDESSYVIDRNNKNENSLDQTKQAGLQLFKNSKVVTTSVDSDNLLKFFDSKQVKGAKLLYRASENGYLISKFHERCDGIPHTLTVLTTQFNKIIGGYTPLTWGPQTGKYVKDESGQSFIFSLTNQHKFTLQQKQAAIQRHEYNGPIFGGGCDLLIRNKANQNNQSYAKINSYINPHYKKNDKESKQRFSGNPNLQSDNSDNKFRVLQWQVYSVELM